jgi:hypothetical protein
MSGGSFLPFDLPAICGKKVAANFDGGATSSDGGLLLPRQADRRGSVQILSHIFSSDGGFGWVFLGLKQWPHVHVPFRRRL